MIALEVTRIILLVDERPNKQYRSRAHVAVYCSVHLLHDMQRVQNIEITSEQSLLLLYGHLALFSQVVETEPMMPSKIVCVSNGSFFPLGLLADFAGVCCSLQY